MKLRSIPLVIAGGMMAAGMMAAPAMADPAPCPTTAGAPNSGSNTANGGTCTISATVTVPETLAIAVSFTSISIPFGSGWALPSATPGYVYALSNAKNYYITMASTDLVNTIDSTAVIPAADISGYQSGGMDAPLGSPATFVSVPGVSGTLIDDPANTPSGWDSFKTLGFGMNASPTVEAGTYAGTVSYTLWGA